MLPRKTQKSIHIENANQIPLLFKQILSYGRQNYNHCESAAPCCWKNASCIVFLRNDQVFVWEKKNSDHSTFWREKQINPQENRKKKQLRYAIMIAKKKEFELRICDWYIQLLILFILLLKLFTLLFKMSNL